LEQICKCKTESLNTEIVKKILENMGLTFADKMTNQNSPPLEGCPTGGVVITTIYNTPIVGKIIENLPHNRTLNKLARDKRKTGILSEVLFWKQVHKGSFHKIDFDRQRIIGNYIVDFYVKALGLVIEIDGNSHIAKVEYDRVRQSYLEGLGLKVFRCSDLDVKKQISNVMLDLEQFILDEFGKCTTPVFDHPSSGGEFASN
jgi:very-short-patch-repair endonuclease